MLQALGKIARQAGKMMLDYQHPAIHAKEGHFNFVTDADVAVQEYLRRALKELCPEARFFAEEQDNAPLTNEKTFVVDPIDGTLNYMKHRNLSAVSIGLLENKTPIAAVIYNPFANELFTAEKGRGAFLNGQPIHVSQTEFSSAMVAFGTSPYDADLARVSMRAAEAFLIHAGDLRRTGSAAIDLSDVACGRADVFFELRLRPWDVAAGALLVTEAGGRFVSLDHSEPWFDDACGVLAVNLPCEAQAVNILKEARQ